MAKRGESGLSFIVGVDKPIGISSHDVVNRCRTVFGEKRIGHGGTLDPLAQGVLPICVGPATRLNDYLSGQNKQYRFTVCFGARTDTDDTAGRVIETGPAPDEILDPLFAQSFVADLVGTHEQIPPQYSAIKIDGKRAYKKAREGEDFVITPRMIEVFEAELVGINGPSTKDEYPCWRIVLTVSKGTYIRAIARDIGKALGCPAHVGLLERTRVGTISLSDCIALDDLEASELVKKLDPVKLLGYPEMVVTGSLYSAVQNGNSFSVDAVTQCDVEQRPSRVSVIVDDRLKALYDLDNQAGIYKPKVVFSIGVSRG